MGEKEMFELTTPQRSIWMMEQFYKGTNINNICATLTINKDVDIKKLNQAINIFVQRNKSFGLNFKIVNGELKQYFTELKDIQFEQVKLKDKKAVRKLAKETAEEIFDIEGERLFKFKLFKLDNNNGGFVVMTHHLISDAGTMSIIGKEVTEIYSKIISGEEIEEKEYSYEQYILDEKEYLKSQKFIKDKKYWCDNFATIPEVAKIPVVSGNSREVLNGKSTREEFILNIDLVTKISQFCSQNKISNFNFFMAVYAIYIGRVSNLKDFVIGTPILNRTNFKEKHTTGMFINTAPLRIKIDDNVDFISFATSIAQSSISMLRYQKYSYQLLLEELRKTHGNLPTLFDVMLSYQVTKANDRESKIPYEVEWIPSTTISNGIYIHLHDNDDEGTLNIDYDYQIEKYNKKDMENMHNRILHIIDQVLETSNMLVQDIEIVTEEEKYKILYEFNNTKTDYPKDKTIVDLFEEQVEKTPDNVAIVCGKQNLTYRELNEKANSLANYLVEKYNIQNQEKIGLYIDKSLESIIAILATIKLGGIYVPIDIKYPKERTEYILQDTECKAILTKGNYINSLPKEKININIEVTENLYKNSKKENLKRKVEPEDLIYIMYTSGSTGKPKGVMIKHRNIVRLVKNTNYIDFSKCQNILQTGSIVFDACTFEIWGALLNGLTLYIIETNNLLTPDTLEKYLKENNIDTLWLTAPLFNQLCENNPLIFKTVKYLLTGGDVLSPKHINMVKDANPDLTIINGYGPTENTTFSCYFRIDKKYNSSIPIGKPISNSTAYVVSENGKLQPIGVKGEIWVGGDGVGKGYLNREDLTQEKFIKNPYGTGTIYKTGDVAELLQDGNIKFIGRIDGQVKVRGFRIELNEIDSAVNKFPEIYKVFTLIKDANQGKAIVTYFTASKNIDIKDLREFLKKELPLYMMPNNFVQIEKFPLNVNGKIDKNKLLEITVKEEKKNILAPKNENEKILLNIFKEILQKEDISISDSFFELGGDSLSAIKLTTKIFEKFKIQLGIKIIFDNPTISELAQIIEETNEIKGTRIQKSQEKEYYETSSAQKRIYYASAQDEESTLYNISGALILDKMPDVNKLENSINLLLEKHSGLRTTFKIINGELMQKIERTKNIKLDVKKNDLLDLDKIFKNFVKPFKLTNSQLIRMELNELKDGRAFFIIDIHHSICDGTSLTILLNELLKTYNGEKIEEEKIEYKDFAEWEYKKLQNKELKNVEEYWINQFKEDIPILDIPTTYKGNGKNNFDGNSEYVKITSEMVEKTNKLSEIFSCTPYMIYLAVYYILLLKYTGQKDIIVGTPISGRYLSELENVIGMFVNTLPLRSKIDAESSFSKYIQEIKMMCLNAFENQEYPLELINDKIQVQREDGKRRLFDTMFIFQNNGYPEFKLDGIDAKYYIPKPNVSKFDISLELIPNNEKSLDMRVEYCTDLFDKEYVRSFGEHYLKILQEVCNDKDVKIKDINILTEKEKNILKEFNNTAVEYSKDKSIIKLFETQAKMHPDETAIIFENKKVTYKILNEKANILAHELISKNVTPKNVVGILLSRSENVIVSMLATLKAGCAYMLIDPDLPNDRITYMLFDSNAQGLITEETAKYIKFKNKVFIDKTSDHSTENISIEDSIDNPFSIIYTSGSTGKPKGIKTRNKGILNLINSYKNILKLERYNKFLSICSMSFDMFTVEIILPLLLGKTLILTNEEEHKSPIDINNIVDKYNVEIMFTTPSKCHLLLMANNSEKLKKLKNIQFGGESFKTSIYYEIKALAKHIEIYNEYGPSEITSCCSIKHIVDTDDISIGKPINNTQIYILNENNKICPINVPGEICIAGDGVSLGYVNNINMTEKTFIENPFGEGLIYKSGDIGKINSNGEIEYINRKDEQIKIRGLRVELSEIEKQIISIPEVTNGAVIYKKEKEYISAFVCGDGNLDTTKIREELAKKLPLYMVPKYITQIESLPITRNGKIDRKILQQYKENIENSAKYVKPETEQEKLFCEVWEKLLNTKIGIETDVFESGADSLIAIKFKTELLALNIRVSYADIFKYKTVKEFCKHSDIKEESQDNYDYTNINKILEKNDISNIVNIENNENNNVLLFGGTGFVGAHIIESFINNDKGNIYCIVRDKYRKKGRERLIEILHFYFEEKLDKYIDNRIFIINGDIYKENFNLTNAQIQEIIKNVNIIINTAAIVKHFGDEQEFIDININATQNIINFCKENGKRMIHISTLSVSGNSILEGETPKIEQTENINFSEKDLYKGQIIENNYTKSKFEAERRILENIDNGLNAQILRLGNITNRYSDGKFQINVKDNAFANKIKSFVSLGCIPEYMLESYLEFTPVDICANAIIKIIQNYNKYYTVFHLYNNNHVILSNFIKYLKKSNIDIKFINEYKFKEKIEKVLNENDRDILSGIVNDLDENKKLRYNSKINITNEFTRGFLYKIGFEWPIIDEKYVEKYIQYLIKVKFLKGEK